MKTPDVVKINKGLKCCKNADCDPCPYYSYHGTIAECLTALASDTMAYITQLEQRLASAGKTCPEWISVKDRMPEPNTDVLVIAHGWKDRSIYIGRLEKVESQESWLTGITNKESDWKIWGFCYLVEPIVTHWMPLPSTEGLK